MTITITQNWARFTVTYMSTTGTSKSDHVWIKKYIDTGLYSLFYTYGFLPTEAERSTNPAHRGLASLDFSLSKPDKVTGAYFTHGNTAGDIMLVRS